MCGIWLYLCIQEGIQDGYQMIYTPLYFITIKNVYYLDVEMTYWHSCFWDAHIFYAHNMSINKTTFWEQVCIIWFFMLMLYVYLKK